MAVELPRLPVAGVDVVKMGIGIAAIVGGAYVVYTAVSYWR